ncbi:hypothetical protein QQ045_006487 [Rhodiola kirilowii]
MEAKSKSRKRKDYSLFSSSSRVVTRSRLNVNGDRLDRRGADDLSLDGEFVHTAGAGGNGDVVDPVPSVKDLRVHRVFTHGSIGSMVEMEMKITDDYSSAEGRAEEWSGADLDCDRSLDYKRDAVVEKTWDSEVYNESNFNSLGQNGTTEELEAAQDCFQSTPPDVVLGESKVFDPFEKTSDRPPKSPCQQLTGRRSPGSISREPCFRPKLVGNRSSFSYRRLLPYLMEMTKGAFKSLDTKPQLPMSAESSVAKSSLCTVEPDTSYGIESSSLCQELSPSEPNFICIENNADTEVPVNSSTRNPEGSVCIGSGNLSYGQAKVSTDVNDKLSQFEFGKATAHLGGMALCHGGIYAENIVSSDAMADSSCVDPATQQSPDENKSDLVDVFGDAPLCKHLGLADVHAAEKKGLNHEKPQSNICGKNFAELVQETPLGNEIFGRTDETGMVVSSEANTTSNETMGGSSCVDENKSDLVDVFGDTPLCKHLGLAEVHAAEKKGLNHEKPQSNICGKNFARLVQETPPGNEIFGRTDETGMVVSSEANTTSSNENMGGSSCIDSPTQQSPGEHSSELINVLGDTLSFKRQDLGDVQAVEKNGVNPEYDKPLIQICSQNTAKFVQETPLSNEESGRKDVIRTGISISKPVNETHDGIITSSPDCEQSIVSADKKHSSSSERKLYLKPRRLKIFNHSNSVNYRRMLPYLTEIHGDGACSSSVGKVKKVGPAVQVDVSIKKNHPTVTSARGTEWPGDSSPISAASSVVEPELSNFGRASELKLENTLKSTSDLQISSHGLGPVQFPTSYGCLNLHFGECVEKSPCSPSNIKEEDMAKTRRHSDDLPHLTVDSIHLEHITHLGRPFVSPTRGILKRNPRGCRGLCTCLKCASFRLNAEKAFEFSRTQLLDSEEIALELINEMSLLGNLLKKSTDADSGKPSDVQVQEVCRKAYAIEQQAKARFEQMNNDLNIHCQIPNLQRQTVSFARHSTVKVVQTAHESSKQL